MFTVTSGIFLQFADSANPMWEYQRFHGNSDFFCWTPLSSFVLRRMTSHGLQSSINWYVTAATASIVTPLETFKH